MCSNTQLTFGLNIRHPTSAERDLSQHDKKPSAPWLVPFDKQLSSKSIELQRTPVPRTQQARQRSLLLLHTISILVKETEGFLEFSNLFFGKLVRHGYKRERVCAMLWKRWYDSCCWTMALGSEQAKGICQPLGSLST